MNSADDLLEALDPEQRAVATALRGPVCVIAGAGTGKTRAITHRIAYGVATSTYNPTEVLAVTFTARAAGEMRTRLRQLGAHGVQARTFHAAALRQARYFWPHVYGGELPELTASKLPLLGEALRRTRIQADAPLMRDLASEIEWSKVSNVDVDTYVKVSAQAGRSVSGMDAVTVSRVFHAYEEVKRDRGRIDMEDVLLCTAALLADDERVAAQIRRQYRWLVVDEYQDVNPLQAALLDLWRGGRDDICVVGDPRQTIYSFAGASPRYLNEFTKRHPKAERIELVRNYRSTPQVVDAANKIFSRASQQGFAGVTLQAQSEPGPAVTFEGYADEPAEADATARKIRTLRDSGVALRDMAVLFRINAQSVPLEEALGSHGIPFIVRGVERFFDRPEVRQASSLLRASARAADGEGSGLLDETTSVLASLGYAGAAPQGSGAVRERWESLHAIVSMAGDLAAADPAARMKEFVVHLEQRAQAAHAPAADGVTLATMHSAKGLEWDAVFCAGMHEGTVPSPHAADAEGVEEERRLFYVGVTRARAHLCVSWSAARTPGGRGNRGPTRFLDPLVTSHRPTAGRAARGATGRPVKERKVARCRSCNKVLTSGAERKLGRCMGCPATYDEGVYESLREWRTEQATEQKLPAYCIFTDATLIAIAESRPTDTTELARVPGVGKVKLDRYAGEVLKLLEAG